MSISTATDRPSSRRRLQPRHILDALLLAIGLIASVAAIAIASTTSYAGRQTPTTITLTQAHPIAEPSRAPVLSAPGATFRDPATHELIPVDTPTAREADFSLGHRMNP